MYALKQKYGFSLVELLVVISTIAILTSILIPIQRQATQQTRAIRCMSNLRQIGIASIAYADQNFDKWPHQDPHQFGYCERALWDDGGNSWCRKIYHYLGNNPSVFICPMVETNGREKHMNSLSINYLYNGVAIAFKRTQFDQHSRKILVQDSGYMSPHAYARIEQTLDKWTDDYTDYPAPVYSLEYKRVQDYYLSERGIALSYTWNKHVRSGRDGRNILWMDGHVQWHKWGTFLDSYLPSKVLKQINYERPVK